MGRCSFPTPCRKRTLLTPKEMDGSGYARRRHAVFSAGHDQEYAPRHTTGARQDKNILPDCRCESAVRLRGEETGTLRFQSKFCRHAMACIPAMRRRTFREHLFFPKSMANMMMDLHVHAPAARQRNFAGAPRHVLRLRTSPRSSRRSLWRA